MKLASSGNPHANTTTERIYQVLGNLVNSYNLQLTYVDNADLWMGILVAADFVLQIKYHQTKQTSPG